MSTTCYVGLGRRDITPDEPVPLNESGWCDISKGVHSPLFARSVAFRQADRTAILVSCDVIALSNDLAKALRADISAATGIPTQFIMVAATQNHASPKILPADETDAKGFDSPALRRWLDRFKAEVVRCAQEAVSTLKPACLGMGRGEVRGIAGNRRPLRADGRAVMTWYRPAPESIVEWGFEDPTLEIVRITDQASGSLRGVLMNFACHPNTLWTTELIASDFPGRACQVLEMALGGGVIPVYFNGLCGNIDPFKYMRVPKNAFTAPEAFQPGAPVHFCLAESLRFGNMLGGEALKVAEGLEAKPVAGPIRAGTVRFTGPLRPEMQFDPVVEVQAIAVGDDLAFVGIPGEPFAEIQQQIRAQSPFGTTFACGHANGFAGYIPTEPAYQQGGYETGNPWTKFGPGIGELVREAALMALRDMKRP